MKLVDLINRVIEYSFYILFFLIPLILTPFNYELFEYNKMMAVYGLTTIIVGAWLIKMVAARQIIFRRTPFDLPLLLFLLSQVVSTFFSIDRHVSLWGYYSRFHGGLLSTISYIALYYALVSNISRETVVRFLKVSLLSALVVSAYGILEHFGIDKNLWIQDVQNRVFSTLGQPNWLAAYLVILTPLTWGFILMMDDRSWKMDRRKIIYYLLSIIYYLTLLYTKSRSGLLGLGVGYIFFWTGVFFFNRQSHKIVLKSFFLLTTSYLILTATVGSPWTPSLQSIIHHPSSIIQPKTSGPALEVGGTESGEIRKIVWKGALDIAQHYPLFGSGVETFAFSYYQFRPKEHNLVSEWDFLYNKAHNEYLNYAATTGFVGLGAYLLLIVGFISWSLKKMWEMRDEKLDPLLISLLAGYISILITNFFGFSVVPVALYFWLIPAFVFVLNFDLTKGVVSSTPLRWNRSYTSGIFIVILLFSIFYFLFSIFRIWYADTRFSRAYQLAKTGFYKEAYQPYREAINLNSGEPFYRDEFSYAVAVLAASAWEQKEATLAGQLANEALSQNKIALTTSPANVNFWKTRTKIFYALSAIDEKYNEEALTSLLTAQKLAPTDVKIAYNLGLLYGQVGNKNMAVKALEETIDLKPNYREARYALALFYNDAGDRQKAVAQLEYILDKIATDDAEAKEKLKEWGIK